MSIEGDPRVKWTLVNRELRDTSAQWFVSAMSRFSPFQAHAIIEARCFLCRLFQIFWMS